MTKQSVSAVQKQHVSSGMLRGDFDLCVSHHIDLSDTLPQILVPVCACITVVALAVFMLYEGLRLWRKRKRALSSHTSSPAPEDQVKFLINL